MTTGESYTIIKTTYGPTKKTHWKFENELC